MTAPTLPGAGGIALVELHDARVEKLSLGIGSELTLDFSHVSVFVQVSDELFDVWSYRAALRCQGVSHLELKGGVTPDDYVSDGTILGEGEKRLRLGDGLNGSRIQSLELVFGSGAKLLVRATHLKLELLSPLEKVEQWHGPLGQSDRR